MSRAVYSSPRKATMKLALSDREMLGRLLRSLAARQSTTQEELSEDLGIDRATISKVWRGDVKKSSHYESIAQFFGLSLEEALEHAQNVEGILDAVLPTQDDVVEEDDADRLERSFAFGPQAIVVAVASQKGGTGKTTCAVNLADQMAQRGHAVLLIDLDPQGDATLHLGHEPRAEHYVDAVRGLKKGAEDPASLLEIVPTGFGFDLIPSGEDLEEAAERINAFAVSSTVLRKLLSAIDQDYDVVIIDCQPTLGVLQKNAIVAATHLVFPVQLHQAAINGLDRMMSTVDELRELNPMCRVLASVPCFDENTVLAREMMRQLRQRYYAKTTEQSIPKNISIAEAYAAQEPVGSYEPNSNGAIAFKRLARELEDRLGVIELDQHTEVSA